METQLFFHRYLCYVFYCGSTSHTISETYMTFLAHHTILVDLFQSFHGLDYVTFFRLLCDFGDAFDTLYTVFTNLTPL